MNKTYNASIEYDLFLKNEYFNYLVSNYHINFNRYLQNEIKKTTSLFYLTTRDHEYGQLQVLGY